MSVPEIMIIALAVVELLAVVAMGIAAFMMYGRIKAISGWIQPAAQESKAIAARVRTLARETKARVVTVATRFRTLAQHVSQKARTATRLAREVMHPDLTPLAEASRVVTGPNGLATRLSRLHEAGKIAAGRSDGERSAD